MTDETAKAIESTRAECLGIALAEYQYWKRAPGPSPEVEWMEMGAMGAAANILCALLKRRTAAEHEAECQRRDIPPTETAHKQEPAAGTAVTDAA